MTKFVPPELIPGAVAEMFAQATHSGVLTLSDRYGLMAAIFNDSLSDEEQFAINRLLRLVQRKQFQLFNEVPVRDKPV